MYEKIAPLKTKTILKGFNRKTLCAQSDIVHQSDGILMWLWFENMAFQDNSVALLLFT